jgi:hydrogenase expression/formation protein HypC
MCLGIPMQIISIDGYDALCEAKGVQRQVNLFLLQDQGVSPGDFVLVHVGYAIQTVSQPDALCAWELYDQMQAVEGAI